MELTKTIVEANNLTPEQVTAIEADVTAKEADIKKEFDGKANTDAQAIISGAAGAVTKLTGIQLAQGQKIADFIQSAGSTYVETQLATERTALNTKKLEYEEKIKDGGNQLVQKELDDVNAELDTLKQKEASFNELVEGDFKTKYDDLVSSNSALKVTNAFTSVKPTFPEAVNKYEADTKFREWKTGILAKYNIEFDEDGDAIAVDKENKYTQKKLSDLLEADKNISALMEGRKQKGTGFTANGVLKIEKVPFDVPEDRAKRSQAITDYLLKTEKLKNTDALFAKRFGELNLLIKQGTA